MKVDAAVQRLLLDLADSDAEINRLEHRRKNLPEDVETVTLAVRFVASPLATLAVWVAIWVLCRQARQSRVRGWSGRGQRI